MTIPDPNPEICGRFHQSAPGSLKQAREDYIRARREEGYLDIEIAAALGISSTTLSLWTRKRNMGRCESNWLTSQKRLRYQAKERLKWAMRNAKGHLSENEIREVMEAA